MSIECDHCDWDCEATPDGIVGIEWCGGFQAPNDPSGRWAVESHHPQRQRTPAWDLSAWPEARPLDLRRSGSWAGSYSAFHPRGDWLVASTHNRGHLTFWPLRGKWPRVVDGYEMILRPLAFSADGKWGRSTRPGKVLTTIYFVDIDWWTLGKKDER